MATGYRGTASRPEHVPEPVPLDPEARFISRYLSPTAQSATIHALTPDRTATACKPLLPLGRVEARPEAQRPTCGVCLITTGEFR